MATTILEHCQVAPSTDAPTKLLLPLLHFDIVWLSFHLQQNLIFYEIPCSRSRFMETIVPKLKRSLSLTLKHFPPLAGKIVFPLGSGMPVSHYKAGDTMSLTIAESNADFLHLSGDHPRDADEFYQFLPQLPPADYSSDFIKIPVAAIQVTLFPMDDVVGISIGSTCQHAIADGASLLGFIQTWASINKFDGDGHLMKILPSYDRSTIEGADGLAATRWERMKMHKPTDSLTISFPTNKVRATFSISRADILKLKNSLKPSTFHVSSFTVACAYVWMCLARSAADAGEVLNDEDPEYLTCTADCRGRLNPPLPDTYFGNCLALLVAETTHGRLKGNDGFQAAAEAIGEAIDKTSNNGQGILAGSEKRLSELRKLLVVGKRILGVAGSPRFDIYDADYGWGRAKKYEDVDIDCNGSISLCESREFEGVLEVGLSMPKIKMDAFAAIFNKGLNNPQG